MVRQVPAVYDADNDMVRRELFDAAIEAGSTTVQQASRYLALSKSLIDAIEQAAEFLSTGRADQAHDRLRRALTMALRAMS